jgi:hypothetical protein
LDSEVVNADSNTANMTEYISISEASKLVTPFKGERMEVLTFIPNVTAAFGVRSNENWRRD